MSDELRFGDPIGCRCPHSEPREVERYGDAVRLLGARVGAAESAFRATASMPEESFAGEAADALLAGASRRLEEADQLGGHLRAVGRAVAAHADFLRRHREFLESLRDLAVSRGLRVEGHRIWAPVETISGEAVAARDGLQEARGTVGRLTTRYDGALDELERLLLADAPAEELMAQAGRVQLIDSELVGARAEARDAAGTFREERCESNQAARDLRDAERPGPPVVRDDVRLDIQGAVRPASETRLAPVRDVRDRLG